MIGCPAIFFLNGNSSSLKLYTTVVVVGGAVIVLDVDGVADSSAGRPRPDEEEEVLKNIIININNI